MNGIYNNISPVINTAPQEWIDQQTFRGIGPQRSRIYVDPNGDLWGQFENNPPKKIANLGGPGSSSSIGVPVGAVFQWIGAVAPVGYIMCDGNAVSGLYPKLIALLTSYGGKTPDLRGRFVIGASTTSPSYTSSFPGPLQLMANGGAFETTLDIQHLPEHSHEIEEEEESSHTHLFDVPDHTHSVTTQTATGHSHSVDSPDATVTHWTGSAWDSQGNDGVTGDNDAWEPSFDTSTWTNSVEDSDGGEFYINTDTASDGTDWTTKPTVSSNITNAYTGAAKVEDSDGGEYSTWAPTLDAVISSDDTTDSLYTSATFAEGDGVHYHTLAVGAGGGHGHSASSASTSTSTPTTTVSDTLSVSPTSHNHAAGGLDHYWGLDGVSYRIEGYWDDNGNDWFAVAATDDAMNSIDGDNYNHQVGGSTANETLSIAGSVDVDTSVDTATTTTTTIAAVGDHTHTGGTVTAATADATNRGGHTHTFGPGDTEGDITVSITGHEITDPDHVHSFGGSIDSSMDANNWEHSHKTNIDNLHHTHALTDTSHYHSFDIDLEASTNSTNNGVSWVGPMGASGTAATAGGVTDRETSASQGASHAHGGRTGNAGLSTPDPVQSLPPYIAMNFIIKHD